MRLVLRLRLASIAACLLAGSGADAWGQDEPGPQLTIRLLENRMVELVWPSSATDFRLESAVTLAPSLWELVTANPAMENDQNVVRLPLAGQRRYFRLRRQAPTVFHLVEFLPKNGAGEVGVTYRPKITFSEAANLATLTSNNFFAMSAGQRLPARIVPGNDGRFAWLFFQGSMPGGARIQITVDGSSILSTRDVALDADGDGQEGGRLNFEFTTVNQVALPGTTLSGLVVDPGPDLLPFTSDDIRPGPDGLLHTLDDQFLLPIEGVEVYLLGREFDVVTTDQDGRFEFAQVPAGNVKVVVNGLTAFAPPAGYYFPEMVMDAMMQPGVENFVMMGMPEMYLPRLASSILRNVGVSTNTMITVDAAGAPLLTPEQRSRLTLEVPTNSLVAPDGTPLTSGQVGISTVPPELVRDMLPPGVLQHTFDITVQAMGIATFSTPAPMTFPNVFNAAPGTKLNFLSFDHTTGRLVIEGTATVSSDGLSVRTDPGTGITHPGWHGLTSPGTPTGDPCPPQKEHDIKVTPIVNITRLQDYLFVNDEGLVELGFQNAAAANPQATSLCDPTTRRETPLVVEVSVDGPVDEFLDAATSIIFHLYPQEQKTLLFFLKPFLPGIREITQDRLYGVVVHIKAYQWGEQSNLIDENMYIYRFVDAADDNHGDGVVAMPDTAVGIERFRRIDVRMPASATPQLALGGAPHFSDAGFPSSFIFRPSSAGAALSATATIKSPTGLAAGTLTLRGAGKHQTWFVNRTAFESALANVAVSPVVTGPVRALIDSAPERSALVADVLTRTESLLQNFDPAIVQSATVASDSIQFASFNQAPTPPASLSTATSDFVDNAANGGALGLVAARPKFSVAEQNYRLSRVLNQSATASVLIHTTNLFLPAFNRAEFVNTIAKTLAHEIGHTVGLIHTVSGPAFIGADRTVAETDIMAQGTDSAGSKTFRLGLTFEPFNVALGHTWGATDAQTALDYFAACQQALITFGNLDGPANEPDANIVSLPVFNGAVAWIVTRPGPKFVGPSFDLGAVLVDGTNGQRRVEDFDLSNLGDRPLNVVSLALVEATPGFVLSPMPPNSVIAPGTNRTFTLTFDPTNSGPAHARLRLRSNALAGDYDVVFTAFGLSPARDIRLLSANNNVGGAFLGQPARLVTNFATITNIGSQMLSVNGISMLTSGGLVDFRPMGLPPNLSPLSPLQIAPSNSFTFGVAFAPGRLGLRRGVIGVASNDPDTPLMKLTVVGTGIPVTGPEADYGNDHVVMQTPGSPDNAPLRTISDSQGGWSLFVSAEERYHTAIFDSVSGLIAHMYGKTASSGSNTELGEPVFRASTAPDSDGDGLPDDVEFAIGTSPDKVDTDGDGVSDYDAIQNGIDPFSGAAGRMGTRAAAATAGRAIDIAADQNLAAAVEQRRGVAIFDITDGTRLTLLARISSLPDPRRVALANRWLAVAEASAYVNDVFVEGGLSLFDLTDPASPRLVQRYTLETINAVTIWNGFVFAGADRTLYVIDLETGAISDQTELDTFDVADIVGFGDYLYVVTTEIEPNNGRNLYTFSVNAGKLQLLSSLMIGGEVVNERLVAAPGRLYAVHLSGYTLLSLSNPAAPAIVTNVINTFINGFDELRWGNAALASPDLMLVGADTSTSGQSPTTPGVGLNLFALGVGGQTNSFLRRFPSFDAPRSLAVAWSQAYIAEWNFGVRLVRYLALDTNGVPPTVKWLPSFNTNGVPPGASVSVVADARDDVQVRTVEFYVNGLLTATDVSYPFEYRFVIPKPQNPNEILSLRARAVDTGGNEAWSDELAVRIAPMVTNFFVVASSETDGRVFGMGYLSNLWATFNTPVDPATLSSNNFYVVSAGNDGQLGTSDDSVISARPPRYAQGLNAAFLDFEPPLTNGLYRATLGPAVRDQSGNSLVSNRVWNLRIAHFDVATSHGFVMQGNIDFPGALDSFTFSAAAGQRLFFHLPPDSFRPIVYRSLLDPNYQVMREGNLGSVLGAITLTNAGIYSFFIGGITFFTDTGPYQLPVTEVPPPQEFNVAIGTTISPNQPGLGAGTIEAAGAKDVYWFNATAGQAITIDLVRYDFSLTLISMRVEEAGGTSLLDRWLGFGSATLTLEQGGAYRLVIGSDLEPGTGTYQIRLQPQ